MATRKEYAEALQWAHENGDTELAQFAADQLSSPLSVDEVIPVFTSASEAAWESMPSLKGLGTSREEAFERAWEGKAMPGQEHLPAVREKLYAELEAQGIYPNTEMPSGGLVSDWVDGGLGFAPSAASTINSFVGGALLRNPRTRPLGYALTGAGVGGMYDYSVSNSVHQLTSVLAKDPNITKDQAKDAVKSVWWELTKQGLGEAGSELTTVATGALASPAINAVRDGLVRVLGTGKGKEILAKITAGGFAWYVGTKEEQLSEATGAVYQKSVGRDVEKKLGLEKGSYEGIDPTWEEISSTFEEEFRKAFPASVVGVGSSLTLSAAVDRALERTGIDNVNNPLVHEGGKLRKLADSIADTVGRKSVSVLDQYIKLTGNNSSAAQLRDRFEHREMGDAPGVVKSPDYFEQKLKIVLREPICS